MTERLDLGRALPRAARQQQFLEVIEVEEAQARLRAQVDASPRPSERVALGEALGRVLAEDVVAPVDVPGFVRASVDGFAIRAADTGLASDASPCRRSSPLPRVSAGHRWPCSATSRRSTESGRTHAERGPDSDGTTR